MDIHFCMFCLDVYSVVGTYDEVFSKEILFKLSYKSVSTHRAGEMALWSRLLVLLLDDLGLISSTHMVAHNLSATPIPGHLMSYTGLLRHCIHITICVCRQDTHT